ncbi:nitroreductase family protein [Enterococcus sp. 5H]|uniref:nitroreductase family protein n=1 Tax=Enterococcus sp. 5H TaxID=1229490 RepID=UPI002302D20B|nr:nitroreductase family protein [Enterococcus sp. 5H]MDA9470714.1 NADH dehydrogenase [Enterococcus sp. 5H]
MENTYKENNFDTIMKGRRSVRNYDPAVKISREEMEQIINDTVKAPSSVNMQPWRFVVVESNEGKEKIEPLVRFNKLQNETSAAMIVIFGDLNSFEHAEKIYGTAVEQNLMPQEVKERQLEMLSPLFEQMTTEDKKEMATIDGALAAMNLMLVARAYGYDTNPIGGFEREKIAAALDMDSERYYPVMIVSIGKANEEGYPSYRLPAADITTWK